MKLQVRLKGVLREFSGSFKEVSRVFHESFMEEEVSRISQGRFIFFKGVSRVFQGNFIKTFKVLKKCHVLWHSSQLPEQKGLLIYYQHLLGPEVTRLKTPLVMFCNPETKTKGRS